MTLLASQKKIPSQSYAYTAGALYKQSPPLGSLTLGGYDATRFNPNNITFGIDDTKTLLLPIRSISANQTLSSNSSLLTYNITAIIDTTTPHTWLPVDACKAFERAFGLKWDSNTSLYLVNDTAHQQLLNQNPQITFTLGLQPSNILNITLPYAAFDLQASQPFYPKGTNVFPIRRASSAKQYTLGRAFFQEAYLIVDYDTSNFSISQASYPVPAQSNIVAIDHLHIPSVSDVSSGRPQGLSRGTIAGITIGASAGFIAFCILAFILLRRSLAFTRKQKRPRSHPPSFYSSFSGHTHHEKGSWPCRSDTLSPSQGGDTTVGSPCDDEVKHELKGSDGLQELANPDHLSYHAKTTQGRSKTYHTQTSTELGGGLSREESLRKPLPLTPVELMGSDFSLVKGNRASHKQSRSRENVPARNSLDSLGQIGRPRIANSNRKNKEEVEESPIDRLGHPLRQHSTRRPQEPLRQPSRDTLIRGVEKGLGIVTSLSDSGRSTPRQTSTRQGSIGVSESGRGYPQSKEASTPVTGLRSKSSSRRYQQLEQRERDLQRRREQDRYLEEGEAHYKQQEMRHHQQQLYQVEKERDWNPSPASTTNENNTETDHVPDEIISPFSTTSPTDGRSGRNRSFQNHHNYRDYGRADSNRSYGSDSRKHSERGYTSDNSYTSDKGYTSDNTNPSYHHNSRSGQHTRTASLDSNSTSVTSGQSGRSAGRGSSDLRKAEWRGRGRGHDEVDRKVRRHIFEMMA